MDSEHSVELAVETLARGGIVVVADDHDRENEGDLVMGAAAMTDQAMAFFLRYGSGIVCTPMTERRARQLHLPLMVAANKDRMGTAFTVTVDAAVAGTGISAADRTATVHALADPHAVPSDFTRPGHMFPLIAQEGGVLVRRGHTEASVDLMSLAGEIEPTAVITELVDDDGVPMSGTALTEFADRSNLPYVTVADLVAYRQRRDRTPSSPQAEAVTPVSSAPIDTDYGTFTAHVFRDPASGIEHVALTMGLESPPLTAVTARVHSECLTGDAFGSHRCDCGPQLQDGLRTIAATGTGVLVYLRGHEGRGIGIANKLAAYALQDRGADTVDANIELGLPVDAREYTFAAEILRHFGVESVDLITHNPEKVKALESAGIEVRRRIDAPVHWGVHNVAYLKTKRERMGHLLPETPYQFLQFSSM